MQSSTMQSSAVFASPASVHLKRQASTKFGVRPRMAERGLPSSRRANMTISASAKYELLYFGARGAAETSRVIFAVAGVEYEDNRYMFSFVDGKPKVEDRHAEDKAAGKFKQNLDRLPLLIVEGDAVIGQSNAIERYLASEFNLLGANKLEAAQVDAFCEHVRDISTAFGKERGNPFAPMADETKAKLDVWYSETLVGWYTRLEAVTGDNGHVVGESTSLADVKLHQLVTAGMMGADARAASELEAFPKLKAVVDGVSGLEGVQKWLAARPESAF